jgi:hypothetical protein
VQIQHPFLIANARPQSQEPKGRLQSRVQRNRSPINTTNWLCTVKKRAFIASVVGALVSFLLVALRAHYLQAPGAVTVMWIWGVHGGAVPEIVSVAVMIGVNAVVYSLITFGLLSLFAHAQKRF